MHSMVTLVNGYCIVYLKVAKEINQVFLLQKRNGNYVVEVVANTMVVSIFQNISVLQISTLYTLNLYRKEITAWRLGEDRVPER